MSILVNSKAIKTFNFSGGESQVNISDISISLTTTVEAYIYNAEDIMRLAMTINAIRQIKPFTAINLTIPYFPYARQDRVCNEGEAFSVKVMADMINNMGCQRVTVYDPHSQVTVDSINNCEVITQSMILASSSLLPEIKSNNLILVSPDKGAEQKTKDIADKNALDVIYCTKQRDVKTGQILSTSIPTEVKGKDFIIIDDICDGGRTFIELAKKFKKAGAANLYLYVTHGIFSKGLGVLKKYFKKVYCFHTFLEEESIDKNFLTILNETINEAALTTLRESQYEY